MGQTQIDQLPATLNSTDFQQTFEMTHICLDSRVKQANECAASTEESVSIMQQKEIHNKLKFPCPNCGITCSSWHKPLN